jgi:hypothetical protein
MSSTQRAHEVEIVGASLADIEALLGAKDQIAGGAVDLGDGVQLDVREVSKSSGFDVATLIVTGIITVAVNVTTAMLIDYLKSRMSASKPKRPVTITIDGKQITIEP